jgi:hypothetical protein
MEQDTGVPATVTSAVQLDVLLAASVSVRTTGYVPPICEQSKVFGETDLLIIPQLSVLLLSTSAGVMDAVPPDR